MSLIKNIIITKEHLEGTDFLVTSLFTGDRLTELHCAEIGRKNILGAIVTAKVQNIVENIGAAFVELEPGVKGYLPLSDMKAPVMVKQQRKDRLTQGDELLVQIVREPVRTKEAVVSTKLTLTGHYVVLTTENTMIGISKKCPAAKKQELLSALSRFKNDRYGIILRTSGLESSIGEVEQELQQLASDLSRILETAKHRTCFSVLYQGADPYVSLLKGLSLTDGDRIKTDIPEVFDNIQSQSVLADLLPYLSLYQDPQLSLSSLYGIPHKMQAALDKKVWMKSGAYLVIEATEALTVIDVNSGKNTKKNSSGYYFAVNMEAAEEIAAQIRLRNIAGICIIDFINMENSEQESALLAKLRECFRDDPVPVNVAGITKLGLVELTRKKIKQSLYEQIHIRNQ